MSNVTAQTYEDLEPFPYPQVELVETDGEPLDSDWHRMAIDLLIEVVRWFFRDRTDFYAGGNMFIYFSEAQVRNKDYRGPDFFFVWGPASSPPRPYYAVWQEGGRYPNVIIELMSPTTAINDLTEKKDLYQKVFKTREYYCYDPSTTRLLGWHLHDGEYVPIQPDAQGRLECKVLGLLLGTWSGKYVFQDTVWLRFFTPDGKVVPNVAEAAQQQADEQRLRAEAALAELEKLEAQLQGGEQKNGSPA